jgi:DNA-binding NtrC family response regulator
MTKTILIVEDEQTQRFLIEEVVANKLGYNTISVDNGQQAIDYVLSRQEPQPDLILLDLYMPGLTGIDVVKILRKTRKNLPILILTMYGDINMAVQAIQDGANDFLTKPVPIERFKLSIETHLHFARLNSEVNRLKRISNGQVLFPDIIGASKARNAMVVQAKKVAKSKEPLLLYGEAGSGKAFLAQAIHGSSERCHHVFTVFDISLMEQDDVEKALFGSSGNDGKLHESEGGTLYINAVELLPAEVQKRLMRFLQTGEVSKDEVWEKKVLDVRVIASTQHALREHVKDGVFRKDLYHKLEIFTIHVPALRERMHDIPMLAEHFIARYSALENKLIRVIDSKALSLLKSHEWHGNIKQLENMLFRAVALCDGDTIVARDLEILMGGDAYEQSVESLYEKKRLLSVLGEDGNIRTMTDLEHEVIKFALKFYRGKMTEVARRLGIGRSTLYRKMQEMGLRELDVKVV